MNEAELQIQVRLTTMSRTYEAGFTHWSVSPRAVHLIKFVIGGKRQIRI